MKTASTSVLQAVDTRHGKFDLVDWNSHDNAEVWRKAWADLANSFLEQSNRPERIDHRSYKRQGIKQTTTVHISVVASQM